MRHLLVAAVIVLAACSTASAWCGCGAVAPAVVSYAPAAYYAPATYVTNYVPAPMVCNYAPVPMVTYHPAVVAYPQPVVTYRPVISVAPVVYWRPAFVRTPVF